MKLQWQEPRNFSVFTFQGAVARVNYQDTVLAITLSRREESEKRQTQAERGFQSLRGTDRHPKKVKHLPSKDFSRQKSTREKNTY